MSEFGSLEIVIIVCVVAVFAAVVLIPYWRIFKKAGFPPALCFLMIIPIVNLVTLYYLAFAEWPSLKQSAQ